MKSSVFSISTDARCLMLDSWCFQLKDRAFDPSWRRNPAR